MKKRRIEVPNGVVDIKSPPIVMSGLGTRVTENGIGQKMIVGVETERKARSPLTMVRSENPQTSPLMHLKVLTLVRKLAIAHRRHLASMSHLLRHGLWQSLRHVRQGMNRRLGQTQGIVLGVPVILLH